MKLTVQITCDNDAFREDAAGECMRILNDAARRIENPLQGTDMRINDINGHGVARVTVTDD